MTRVGVFGSRGRMGNEVCRAVESAPDLELVAALDLGDDRAAAERAQVMVDFTHPDAVMDNLACHKRAEIRRLIDLYGLRDPIISELSLRPTLEGLGGIAIVRSIGAVLCARGVNKKLRSA